MLFQEVELAALTPESAKDLFANNYLLGFIYNMSDLTTLGAIAELINRIKAQDSSFAFPPIILIGTHADEIPADQHEEFQYSVGSMLQSKEIWYSVFISPTTGFNIAELQQLLMDTGKKYYGIEETPEQQFPMLLIGVTGVGKSAVFQALTQPPSIPSPAPDTMNPPTSEEKKMVEKEEDENDFSVPTASPSDIPAPIAPSPPTAAAGAPPMAGPPVLGQPALEMSIDEIPKRPSPRFEGPPPAASSMPITPSPPGDATPSPPRPSIAPAPPPVAKADKKEKERMKDVETKDRKSERMKKAQKAAMPADLGEKLTATDEEQIAGASPPPTSVPAIPEPRTYHKNLSVEYFDKMNPGKIYPLILNIANIKQATIQTAENILTGERKIQKKDEMEVELIHPRVTVRPVFPGCTVSPSEMTTNFEREEDELTFYIAPLVNDEINGRIDFIDIEFNTVYQLKLAAEVDDPRYAKTVAAYGTLASILPRVLLMFGIDIGNEIEISTLLPFLTNLAGGLFGGMVLTNFIAIVGVLLALIIGSGVYFSKKPRSTQKRFTLTDLRVEKMTKIKDGK
jgi:hypothetical protein